VSILLTSWKTICKSQVKLGVRMGDPALPALMAATNGLRCAIKKPGGVEATSLP
jgi:hypothetical protein